MLAGSGWSFCKKRQVSAFNFDAISNESRGANKWIFGLLLALASFRTGLAACIHYRLPSLKNAEVPLKRDAQQIRRCDRSHSKCQVSWTKPQNIDKTSKDQTWSCCFNSSGRSKTATRPGRDTHPVFIIHARRALKSRYLPDEMARPTCSGKPAAMFSQVIAAVHLA